MNKAPEEQRDLIILEEITKDPDTTQATLASQLGVAIGTINWHLKRLIAKGYVKAGRMERRKLRYILTPEGLAHRARLTIDYIDNSFHLYHLVRQRVIEQLVEVRQAGYNRVRLDCHGDVADVCRLTCLEQGVAIVPDQGVPVLQLLELKVVVNWEECRHD